MTTKYGKGLLLDPTKVQKTLTHAHQRFGAVQVSSSVDLTSFAPSVRNQGSTSSCVGFATCCALHTRLQVANPNADIPIFSPLAFYGLARATNRSSKTEPLTDHGSFPAAMALALATWGAPTEALWPWSPAKINEELPWDVLQQATDFKVSELVWIGDVGDTRIQTLKQVLSAGYPVTFGTYVGTDFEAYNDLQPLVPETGVGGYHMLTLLGYEGDTFIGQNSWGTNWGNKGRFRASTSFVTDIRSNYAYAFEVGAK